VATQQHWLSVHRRKLKTRFLLQDSSKNITTDPKKVNRKIGGAIKKMISALEKDSIIVPSK
jgi:hypothetical protein